MKILVTSDWHFTMRPPEGRTAAYGDDILAKLAQVAKLVDDTGAEVVVCAGDIWHRKADVTHRETQLLTHAIQKMRVPVVSIHGNHDATPSLVKYRAYGTMAEAMTLTDVSGGMVSVPCPSKVRITGSGYDVDVDGEDKHHYKSKRLKDWTTVHLAHGYLMLDDTKPMWDHTTPEQIGKTAEVVICGHYHTHQGSRTVGGTLFICPGALSRPTRAEVDNPVRVGVLTIEGKERDIRWIDLDVSPAQACFVAPGRTLSTVQDAKDVAESMYARGGGSAAEIDDAIEQAVAQLEFGSEVEGDSKARVAHERELAEGGGDAELAGTAEQAGGGKEDGGARAAKGRSRKGRGRKARKPVAQEDQG